jgi:hypothetical protein
MRRAAVAFLLLSALVPPALAPPALAPPALAAAPTPAPVATVSVELNRTSIATRIGERFAFTSTLRNDSDRPVPGRIAHLNILSVDPGVYVDPEDWSARRTQYLETLPPGGSARLAWTVQAVNSGRFVLYVAVSAGEGGASRGGTLEGGDQVSASNALRLSVAQRRTINAGGILPLAVAVPGTVLALLGFTIRRRRRLR